jgi:hypothetical protein
MSMSEEDIPERFERYGGHLTFQRLALASEDIRTGDLPSFTAKTTDARTKGFVAGYGSQCWELDALSPIVLRERVTQAIESVIDWNAWERCARVEEVELRCMQGYFTTWKSITGQE